MKKILLSSLFTIILLFFITLPAFAGEYSQCDVWSFYSMHAVAPGNSNVSMSYDSNNHSTKVINNISNGNMAVSYRLNDSNKWIPGQTYKLSFTVLKTSPNCEIAFWTSDTPDVGDNSNSKAIYNYSTIKTGNTSFSFTYNGQPYLIVILGFSGSAQVTIGDFYLYKYNPNAELESQNQQIIDQNKDLQNKLFTEGETFSMPDIDLSEQYSQFDSQSKDLITNGQSILQSNRIVNGVKAFATYFTSIYSSFQSDEVLQVFPLLMYLTLICSLILLIFGFIRSRGGK